MTGHGGFRHSDVDVLRQGRNLRLEPEKPRRADKHSGVPNRAAPECFKDTKGRLPVRHSPIVASWTA